MKQPHAILAHRYDAMLAGAIRLLIRHEPDQDREEARQEAWHRNAARRGLRYWSRYGNRQPVPPINRGEIDAATQEVL